MGDIDLTHYVRIFRKWLWLIGASVLVAVLGTYLASFTVVPTYQTSLTLLVGEGTANPTLSLDEITTSQRIADAYAGMVRRQPVLEAAGKALGLPDSWRDLQNRVTVV